MIQKKHDGASEKDYAPKKVQPEKAKKRPNNRQEERDSDKTGKAEGPSPDLQQCHDTAQALEQQQTAKSEQKASLQSSSQEQPERTTDSEASGTAPPSDAPAAPTSGDAGEPPHYRIEFVTDLSTLVDHPAHSTLFPFSQEHLDDLLLLIEENGIDEPLIAVPAKDAESRDILIVLAGRYRRMCAEALQLEGVPVVVRDDLVGDEDEQRDLLIRTNIDRPDNKLLPEPVRVRQGMALMEHAQKRARERAQEGRKRGGLRRAARAAGQVESNPPTTKKPLRSRDEVAGKVGLSPTQFDIARKLLADLDNGTCPLGRLYEVGVLNLNSCTEVKDDIEMQEQQRIVESVLRAEKLDDQKTLARALLGKAKLVSEEQESPTKVSKNARRKKPKTDSSTTEEATQETIETKPEQLMPEEGSTVAGAADGGPAEPPTPLPTKKRVPSLPENATDEQVIQRMKDICDHLTQFLLDLQGVPVERLMKVDLYVKQKLVDVAKQVRNKVESFIK